MRLAELSRTRVSWVAPIADESWLLMGIERKGECLRPQRYHVEKPGTLQVGNQQLHGPPHLLSELVVQDRDRDIPRQQDVGQVVVC